MATTDILSGDSPVDNLPVAAGKRRRGRPKKVVEAAVAGVKGLSGDGSQPPPAAKVKKGQHTASMSRSQVHGLVKQQVESALKRRVSSSARTVVRESAPSSVDPGVLADVHKEIVAQQQAEAISQRIGSGRGGRFRHLLV
jgi:hypothetical protein